MGLMPFSCSTVRYAAASFQDVSRFETCIKFVESHRAFPFSSRQSAPTRVSSLVNYIRSRCAKTCLFSAVEGAEVDGRQNEYDRGGFGISNERKRFVGSVSVSRVPRKRDLSISSRRVQLVRRFSSLPTSGPRSPTRRVSTSSISLSL